MRLTDIEKAMILIAMRNQTAVEHKIGDVTILVDEGGGPWGQPMICGAVVQLPYMTALQWCRTLAELEEFLDWRVFDESL